MSTPRALWSSSVGSKVLIALSGLSLVGFLVLHLVGNLLVFVSADRFNEYGDKLIHNPLLIPAELGLAALFLLHVGKTVALVMGGRESRPVNGCYGEWPELPGDVTQPIGQFGERWAV